MPFLLIALASGATLPDLGRSLTFWDARGCVSCRRFVDLTVREGTRPRAMSSTRVTGGFQLAHKGGPPSRQIYADLTPGAPKDVVIPDVGDGRNWLVGMNVPVSPGEVTLCVLHEEVRTTR